MVNTVAHISNNGSLLFEPFIPRTIICPVNPTILSTLARSKLHLSVGGKEKCSLHRWVLLKNSIIHAIPTSSTTLSASEPSGEAELAADEEVDSFMFPDVGEFVQGPTVDANNAEAQWLDSLLEELGDDEDEDFGHDEDDQVFSLLPSPMSSSDDLTMQHYYPPLVQYSSYPFLVPYPPLHSYSFDSSPSSSIPLPYQDPLPYSDQDDVEELSVPDAIDDDESDDDSQSETPTTPSLGRSSSSIDLVDPASIPLPIGRSSLVYIMDSDLDDSYFYPFDPLPFPSERRTYDTYQEC
ncbi:hypothetical protein C8J56DRAFT_1005745 [Mycena floridula]|nr:hypothetical protein C8J56DRAFT_1005745 [Mycena floridula]